MLVGLAKIRVGIPPLGQFLCGVFIESFLSEELVVPFVESHKPTDKNFGLVNCSDFVYVGGK